MVLLIMPFEQCNVYAETKDIEKKNQTVSTIISEYDYYVDVRSMSFANAAEKYGISYDEYNSIDLIEGIIVELSKQNDSVLSQRGMNNQQIDILREYEGSRLEDNPQLRSVLATLSMTLSKVSCSSSYASAKVEWSWNSKPLIMSIDYYETVPCRWKAYNSYGALVTGSYSSTGSYCYVRYYNGSTLYTTQAKSINIGNTNSYAYSPFRSAINGDGNSCWAKAGYMVVRITGSNIHSVDFGFGYNHGISSTIPTITLDGNLGFNYSNGYEMAEQSISINV